MQPFEMNRIFSTTITAWRQHEHKAMLSSASKR